MGPVNSSTTITLPETKQPLSPAQSSSSLSASSQASQIYLPKTRTSLNRDLSAIYRDLSEIQGLRLGLEADGDRLSQRTSELKKYLCNQSNIRKSENTTAVANVTSPTAVCAAPNLI